MSDNVGVRLISLFTMDFHKTSAFQWTLGPLGQRLSAFWVTLPCYSCWRNMWTAPHTLLCELDWLVMVLFTGIALEVDVPPGMVWSQSCKNVCGVSPPELAVCLRVSVRPCCLPAAAAWPPARCGWVVEWCLVTMLVSAAGSSFTYATFNQQPLMADEIKEQSINVWRLWQLCDNA